MESKTLPLSFNFSQNPLKSLSQTQRPTHLSFPSVHSPLHLSQRLNSCKIHLEIRSSKNRFKCESKAESGDFDGETENFRNVARRKKLAVFVAGGGSNFRSIHSDAFRRLIHGEVAVLVTDKPEIFLSFTGSIYQLSKSQQHPLLEKKRSNTYHAKPSKNKPKLLEERQLYVEAAAAICEDQIVWREGGVPLIWKKENPNEYS